MYSKGDMNYPCIQEIGKLTPEQGNLIVEKNLANLKQGIDQLGIIMDLGNIYEGIMEMKVARFPEILQTGNKKSIKSVDELLKILKAMHLEAQRTNIMILLINQVDRKRLVIIHDDVCSDKRHELEISLDNKEIVYCVTKSLRSK